MNKTINILLIEDNPADAFLIEEMLQEHSTLTFNIQTVEYLANALQTLDRHLFDLVLLDLGLPDSVGLNSLQQIINQFPHQAIVVMTGLDDEQTGLSAVREGAEDYLVKGQVSKELLSRSIIYSIERKQENNKKENMNKLLHAMRSIDHSILEEKEIPTLVQKTCANLVDSQACQYAWMFLLDEQKQLICCESAGKAEKFATFLQKCREGKDVDTLNSVMESHQDNIQNSDLQKIYRKYPIITEKGSQHLLHLKVGSTGKIVGMLGVLISKEISDDQEIVQLYYEISHDLTRAMHTLQVEQENSNANKALLESERKLSTLMSNLPGMAYRSRYNANRTMLFVSPGCHLLTEYDPADLTQDNKIAFADLIYDDDREPIRKEIHASVTELRSFLLAYRIKTASGTIKWVLDQGVAIKDEKQNIIALEGFIIDITARILAEKKLEQAREQLELALDAGEHGFWDWDLVKDTVYFSPRYFSMLGYEENELPMSKDTWINLMHPEDRVNILPKIIRLIQEIQPFEIEYRLKTKTKEWKWISARGKAYGVNKNGEPTRAVGIHVDISEKKQAEAEKLRLQKQRARSQKLETIGTLAGGIAHDFNNILTPIVGYADMALQTLPQAHPIYADIEVILQGANRAKDLVQQILTFSRNMEKEKELLSPHLIVNEAIKLLRPSIPSSIEINRYVDTKCPMIFVDPTQLHQIIINLVTNAYQAIDNEHGEITVELGEAHITDKLTFDYPHLVGGSFISLKISDNGRGMDEKVMERIFEPFFSTKGMEEGTGMGLSVVHGIVKSYNGEIMVESEKGHGSSFTIFFPAATNTGKEKKIKKQGIPRGTESILIVDDEIDIMMMINRVLSKLGYHVTIENSSQRALALFRQDPNQFDLILTDLTMPGLTGGELLEEIKKASPHVPVFIMTGYGAPQKRKDLKALNVDKIISKPINLTELGHALRQVFDKAKPPNTIATNYFNIDNARN